MMGFLRNHARRLLTSQAGFSGVSTIISLSTVVVMAGTTGYMVMSSGAESSQKATESVASALSVSENSLQVVGDVRARIVEGALREVYFSVKPISSSTAIPFADSADVKNSIQISYEDIAQRINNPQWTFEKVMTINSDDFLEAGEIFQITVELPDTIYRDSGYRKFTLAVQPHSGAMLSVERSLPIPYRDGLVNLH